MLEVPYSSQDISDDPVRYAHGPNSARHAAVPEGRSQEFTVEASGFYPGTTRQVWVHVPARYTSGDPADLMVFLDGGMYYDPQGEVRGGIVLDNLIGQGLIPPIIGVFVDPGQPGNRNVEYDPYDDRFVSFLERDVLSRVLSEYSITRPGVNWGICGGSSGGNAAITAAWVRPDLFGKVISFVGSFAQMPGGNPYPDAIRAEARRAVRIYMQAATNDLNYDAPEMNWFSENLKVASALAEAGYDFRFVLGNGGHDPNHGGVLLPEALRWLWRSAS